MYTDFTGWLTRHGNAFLLALGVATVVVLLFHPASEINTTYDSRDFIAASENLSSYLYGRNDDGKPLLHRQPLLPLYLFFFTNKILAAKVLNVACLAASLFLCRLLLQNAGIKGFYFYAGMFSILASYPFLQLHFFVWSEPPFVALTLLLTYLVVTNRHIGLILFLCVLLFFIRKSGAFVMLGVIIGLVFDRKIKMASVVTLVFGLVVIAWEFFVLSVSQGAESSINVWEYLASVSRVDYMDAFTAWFLPRQIPLFIRVIVFGVLFVIFVKTFRNLFLKQVGTPEFRFPFILVVCYFICQVLPFGAPDFHEAERYLSVMLPLVFLLMAMMLDKIALEKPHQAGFFTILFLVWLSYPLLRTCYHIVEKNAYGQW